MHLTKNTMMLFTEKCTEWALEAGRIIIIPDYQREYRWEEKQLNELASDIQSGNCYLGQIAVSHNNNTPLHYYLVDGQQRITSIIILLTVLCRQFYLRDDSINIKSFELHMPQNNTASGNGTAPLSPRLNFEANCFPDFQEFIAQVYKLYPDPSGNFSPDDFKSPLSDDYLQKERYVSACSSFNKIIEKNMEAYSLPANQLNYIKEFIRKILDTQVSVVIFDGNSSYESEKVFLDINEKGLRLDNEDILKAYYFQSLSNVEGNEALTTWTNLKKAFFEFRETLHSGKIPLEAYVNYALQTDLLMTYPTRFDYAKFDDDLRYREANGKIHICQLFSDTRLHGSIKAVANFLRDSNSLLSQDSNSPFYKNYIPKKDSTTREIYRLLFNSICRCEMKIVFIALIKMWWLRNCLNQTLTIEDIYQLFSFYIISNVSGVKKEKILFSNDFISSGTVEGMYRNLHMVESKMLNEAYSKATTLKREQEKAEYLSFNIQMFYNDFHFNKQKQQWDLSLTNQKFLAKYSANRDRYAKDHFLIQNGKTISLYNGTSFTITQSMSLLRKRAYNFIYHEDTFGNIDFVTRLDRIFKDRDPKTGRNPHYGAYENDYFRFIEAQLQLYFKTGQNLPSWDTILEKYRECVPEKFPDIISTILEENSVSWSRIVCKHFYDQLPD